MTQEGRQLMTRPCSLSRSSSSAHHRIIRTALVSEFYRAIGWRAPVELASQTMPDPVRLDLEARIIAGEAMAG